MSNSGRVLLFTDPGARAASLLVLVGASGAGKTTLARAVDARALPATKVFYFDSIGVPSTDEMIDRYGSMEGWQRAKTIQWMLKLRSELDAGVRVIFEGQMRLSFLKGAAVVAGGVAYAPLLIDCDDDTRSKRLRLERQQPELASEDMMNWARYLRREARDSGCPILDTSDRSVTECVDTIVDFLARH